MPITEEQRELRRKYIGSSDTPAILGLNPEGWTGPPDVYYSKIDSSYEMPQTEAMGVGEMVEPVMLQWAGQRQGWAVVQPDQFRVGKNQIMSANHDALLDAEQGVEVKCTTRDDDWGEPDTDDVPAHVYAQVVHQMYVSDLKVVWIPVLFATTHMRRAIYVVERTPDVEEDMGMMVEACERFWREHVQAKTPPPGTPPLARLKRLPREPGKVIDLDTGPALMVQAWDHFRQRRLDIEKGESAALAEVLQALGDAEGGRLPDGRMFTFMEQKGADLVDREAMKRDGVYKTYARPTTHRVARIKKG